MITMNYTAFKTVQQSLRESTSLAWAKLDEFIGNRKSLNGLVFDEVKFSPEYRALKAELDWAFSVERSFNGMWAKTFRKEIKQDIAKKRGCVA